MKRSSGQYRTVVHRADPVGVRDVAAGDNCGRGQGHTPHIYWHCDTCAVGRTMPPIGQWATDDSDWYLTHKAHGCYARPELDGQLDLYGGAA